MPSSDWRLTVRHGSSVRREGYDHLEEAVGALEREAREIKSEGPLEQVSAIRDYGPGDRIHARLEVSRGGWLRSRTAGVDVMGDGRFVAFKGGALRRELEVEGLDDPFQAVEQYLRGIPG